MRHLRRMLMVAATETIKLPTTKPTNIIKGTATTSTTFLDITVESGEFEVDIDMSSVSNLDSAFFNKTGLTSLYFDIDTNNVSSMNSTFHNCSKLISLEFYNFNTSQVTDMTSLFENCSKLTSIKCDYFNTLNVTSMSLMFNYCQNIKTLNLSQFYTNKVTDMSYMFSFCSKLMDLKLGRWNLSNVIDATHMFSFCSKLTTVTGHLSNISVDLDLSSCPLTAESAMVFINGLSSGVSGKTLTLQDTTYDLLTEEQIKVGTDKGWTLASK